MEKVKAAWTASSAGVRKHIQRDHNLSRGRAYFLWKTKISLKDVIKVGPLILNLSKGMTGYRSKLSDAIRRPMMQLIWTDRAPTKYKWKTEWKRPVSYWVYLKDKEPCFQTLKAIKFSKIFQVSRPAYLYKTP